MNYTSGIVIKEFDPAPAFPGRTVSSVRNVCLMPTGEIAFLAVLSVTDAAEPQPFALYVGLPGNLRTWLRSDDQDLPGYPTGARYYSVETFQPIGSDKFCVIAEVVVPGTGLERSLFIVSSTAKELIWRKGQPALCPALAATRHYLFGFASNTSSRRLLVHSSVDGPLITQDNDEFIEYGADGRLDQFGWREGLPFPNQVTPRWFENPSGRPALSGGGIAFPFSRVDSGREGVARSDGAGAHCLASPQSNLVGYPGFTVQQVGEWAGCSSDGKVLFFAEALSPSGGVIGLLMEYSETRQAAVLGLVGEAAPGLLPPASVVKFLGGGYSCGKITLEVAIDASNRTVLYQGMAPFSSMHLLWDSMAPTVWRPDQAPGKMNYWALGPNGEVIVNLSFSPSSEQALVRLVQQQPPVVIARSGDTIDGYPLEGFSFASHVSWGLEGGHGSPCVAENGDVAYEAMMPYGAGKAWVLVLAKPQA